MSHTPHELHEEFPAELATLHELKLNDPHFRKLTDSYHEVNRAGHRAETDVEPVSDQVLEDLKKQRLVLLDEVAQILASAKA